METVLLAYALTLRQRVSFLLNTTSHNTRSRSKLQVGERAFCVLPDCDMRMHRVHYTVPSKPNGRSCTDAVPVDSERV